MTKPLPPKNLVLYADDDPDDRDLLTDAFEDYSPVIELVTFHDSYSLLRYLNSLSPLQPQPCLIILDVNMPGLDGKQALQRIRLMEEFRDVPVVMFTTSTLPSEAAFARSFNAGFVTKPLHTRQIHHILEQLIDHCTDEVKERVRTQGGH